MKLFESVKGTVVLVCDRYSAYLTLARELAGKVILQWCWSHQRRTFLDCAAGHVRLRRWCERWIERIAEIYRLNEGRLEHHDRDSPPERQSPAFDAAQAELRKAVDRLFADAEAELAGMSDKALKAKALRSLVRLVERQESIERTLARKHLGEGSLVLYDLTSVYLEGRRCPLARHGHSRDGKKGKLQIEFGLLCNAEGCPVAVEVFAGDTADPKTVRAEIDKLRGRFGLSRVVLVGDRGMLTEARIREEVKPAGLDWIQAKCLAIL